MFLPNRAPTALPVLLLALAMLAPPNAVAQTTYRWIDKNSGQTVFSDHPPPSGVRYSTHGQPPRENETSSPAESSAAPDSPSYAVRQVAAKYPVVLYTVPNCTAPCQQSRALLNARGVPFVEVMLNKQDEVDKFVAQFGSTASLPSLIVGRQNVSGFEPEAWNNLLDLAGYPKTAPYGAKPSGVFAQ